MPESRSHFERFMRAVHRQHVIVRTLEHAGWGLIGGGVPARVILLIAWIFARPALPAVGATLLLGIICGLATGWWRRPSKLDSAIEADRQLNLADLLSTAWLHGRSPRDPWVQTVLNIADARCRN